jgi:GAF domain-containing protein
VEIRDLQRKAEIAELLLAAACNLAESPEPELVYERFHDLLAHVVHHDGIVVSSYDAAGNLIHGQFYNVDREGHIQKIEQDAPARTSAAMTVPVKEEGAVVGVVQLMSDRRAYTPDDLELFQALVTQMAASVPTARLQKGRRRLEAAEAAARAVAAERERAVRVLEAVGP